MDVFLSYASEERALAERVCRVLETEGHEVFFDRDDLGGGDAFGERIRAAIASSDVLVYLISRSSVASPSYALTELAIAAGLTKRRRPAIVPVRFDDTPIDAVPPTLRAYTILEPRGDVPAEIALAVDRLRRQQRQKLIRNIVAGAALMAIAAGVVYPIATRGGAAPAVPQPASPSPRPAEPAAPSTADTVAPRPAETVASRPAETVAPRDPIDELNDAILKRTPPDRRVTLTGMPGNDGWGATLVLADRTARHVFYRLDGETAFTNTGTSTNTNVMTGAPMPNTYIRLPGQFWRRRTVSVKYTDTKGHEHGPYELDFDPHAQFLQFTKQALASISWVSFLEPNAGEPLMYFTSLVSFTPAFKEIRYSFDSDALDTTWPLLAKASEGWPGRLDNAPTYTRVPPKARFVTVAVVYTDGSTERRRYDVRIER